MGLDEVADYGQTQSKSAVLPRRTCVSLPESFEYMRQKFRQDAVTSILDYDFCKGTRRFQPQFNMTINRGELDCV
jgi:hypothetical protein